MNDGWPSWFAKKVQDGAQESRRERGRIWPGFRKYFDPENTDLSPESIFLNQFTSNLLAWSKKWYS